jgi:hypothetical protein
MPQALPLIFAGIGAASAVAGVVSANKARQETAARAAEQELAAKNAGALDSTAQNADANFVLGTKDPKKKAAQVGTATTGKAVTSTQKAGGISASSVGGL